eukprot:XP_001697972.1 predicted protein [Chlamydomonas reinhardtii]
MVVILVVPWEAVSARTALATDPERDTAGRALTCRHQTRDSLVWSLVFQPDRPPAGRGGRKRKSSARDGSDVDSDGEEDGGSGEDAADTYRPQPRRRLEAAL